MNQRDVERAMRAAWEAAVPAYGDMGACARLARVLSEVDPMGVYLPNAPQAPGIDLEETQDVPLRNSPRLRPARAD